MQVAERFGRKGNPESFRQLSPRFLLAIQPIQPGVLSCSLGVEALKCVAAGGDAPLAELGHPESTGGGCSRVWVQVWGGLHGGAGASGRSGPSP